MNDISLENPELYINREVSWIEFNRKVLEEAQNRHHPLLERVKFLSIFSSNLDEFMMIRVSGLRRQKKDGVLELPADGMTPTKQLWAIRTKTLDQVSEAEDCWNKEIMPELNANNIFIHSFSELTTSQKEYLRHFFQHEIFPALTPMAFDIGRPFPFISNLSLNLAVIIDELNQGKFFSRLKIPRDIFNRLIRIPTELFIDDHENPRCGVEYHFIFIEDLISSNIDLLFPEKKIVGCYPFVVTRDADLEIKEDEASDLLTAIEEGVEMRRIGSPIRLEIKSSMPEWVQNILAKKLDLTPSYVYKNITPLRKSDLMELLGIDRPDLKDQPFLPSYPCGLEDDEKDIFSVIKSGDVLFFHPYESFTPVINFLEKAAGDPDVIAIKMTLYRVGPKSPVVDALLRARDNSKQVSVMVELKARFDEQNNIGWARALERAGVHVVYGIVGIKVHSKLCMVVRREKEGLRTYVHTGTGNYNPTTARIYSDIGLITCDPGISSDVSDLFNLLTGYSGKRDFTDIIVSHGRTGKMREKIISLVDNEIEQQNLHGNGRIVLKMNQLVDKEVIKSLYRASQAGVRVDLQVRGICCLRPGIEGVSENITCSSIVGRFLEHSRIFYFRNNGDERVLIGSADMMPRNLNRRVEVLVGIKDPVIRKELFRILEIHLMDTVNCRILNSDGSYTPQEAEDGCDAQQWMIDHRGEWNKGHP